jgi:hypothetical protein
MTVIKRKRKAQSHTATGKALALTAAANEGYPAWPAKLVTLPSKRSARERAVGWYENFLRHRTPDAWQPADAARVAMLARDMAAWEREMYLLMEREGGDASLAEKYRSAVNQASRHLGLSVAIRDPRLAANDALVRAENDPRQLDLDDDLLARPAAAGRLN